MWMLPFADEPRPDEVEVLDEGFVEDEETVGDEVSKTLLVLLPWSISILFHLAIILLAFFLGWVVMQDKEEEKFVEAAPTLNVPPTPIKNEIKSRKPSERQRPSPRPPQQPKVQVVSEIPIESVIAVMSPTATANPLTGQPGEGKFFGAGGGGGGGAQPTEIAFVIDASGSLIDTFPFVIEELKRFIRSLERKQSFTVIFYTDDKVIEVPPRGLNRADSKRKQQVINWIDLSTFNVVPKGSGNPVSAIQRALGYSPQLVYLLSDNITGKGKYSTDQRTLLNEIKRANKGNTKITTIQFMYEDPLALVPTGSGTLSGEDERTLKKISDQTGGEHRFVSAEDLGIR